MKCPHLSGIGSLELGFLFMLCGGTHVTELTLVSNGIRA